MIFEWDATRARTNLRKHGVSFEESRTVFGNRLARIDSDPRHSLDEERLVILGLSERRRLLVVMFTELDEAIRIISARTATKQEREFYEEEAS